MLSKQLRAFCMSQTPFKDDGSIDEDALRVHLKRIVEADNGIYMGSPGAGEGHVLTIDELRRIYEIGVEVAKGKVPLYANPREGRSAADVLEFAQNAASAGVDAVQLYSLSPGQVLIPDAREVERYYRDILDELHHPTVISTSYAVGSPPPPALIARLCRDYEQIVAVNVFVRTGDEFVAYRDVIPAHLPCYGNFFGFNHWLVLGADGYVLAENNVIPNVARRVLEAFAAGDLAALSEASLLLHRYSYVTREWFPATARPVKMALKVLGLGNGVMRPPYLLPPDADYDRLKHSLDALQIRSIEGLPEPESAQA